MKRTHDDIQDEWLVLRCQSGDGDALRTLIARWQPRLAGLAWRLTAQREAAQDIAQDAWLAIVRGLKRLEDPAHFRTWAFRIVRNKCADWTRRRVLERNASNDLHTSAVSASDRPDDKAGSGRDVGLLQHAMAELTADQRAMLSLHYMEGMSIAEIGAVLGVPKGTVKSRLYYARERLGELCKRAES